MSAQHMVPVEWVEIHDGMEPQHRSTLLRKAYRLSRSGPVRVRLRGVSIREVDRALDQAVRELGTGVHGVEYAMAGAPAPENSD